MEQKEWNNQQAGGGGMVEHTAMISRLFYIIVIHNHSVPMDCLDYYYEQAKSQLGATQDTGSQ